MTQCYLSPDTGECFASTPAIREAGTQFTYPDYKSNVIMLHYKSALYREVLL